MSKKRRQIRLRFTYALFAVILMSGYGCGRAFLVSHTSPLGMKMLSRIIDSGTQIGAYSSLAYTSGGVPYVAYRDGYNGTLKMAWLDRSGYWDNVVVTGGTGYIDAGSYGSMGISNGNNYYISYFDPISNALEMVTGPLPSNIGSIAQPKMYTLDHVTPAQPYNQTGLYTSLKLGQNDKVNISYMHIVLDSNDPSRVVAAYPRYVSWSSGVSISPQVVDPGIEGRALAQPLASTAYSTGIAVAPDGTIWLAYYDVFDHALKIAKNKGGTWVTQVVDNSGYDDGQYLSLTLDSKGYPHLSYTENTGTVTIALKYAWYDGSAFHNEYVDYESGVKFVTNSIVLDGNGNPVIAYYDSTFNQLKVAFISDNRWNISILDSALLSGFYPSLALAPTGTPTVTYQQYAPGFNLFTIKFGIIDYNNL